jgi:hypothetical protein
MTPADFDARLKAARAGEQFCYASGSTLKGDPAAKAALRAYFRGEVELVQRRLTGSFNDGRAGTFGYIAVKRRDVRRPYVPQTIAELVKNLLREETRDVAGKLPVQEAVL